MSLTTIPDPRILDVGLAIRLCHKNMIIKKKKQIKKPIERKKLMKKKKKK